MIYFSTYGRKNNAKKNKACNYSKHKPLFASFLVPSFKMFWPLPEARGAFAAILLKRKSVVE